MNYRASAALLHNTRQLMCQQCLSRIRRRRILIGTKRDMVLHGIGLGLDRLCRERRLAVGMNADRTEICAKSRLHKVLRFPVQGLSRRAQDLFYDGWRGGLSQMA